MSRTYKVFSNALLNRRSFLQRSACAMAAGSLTSFLPVSAFTRDLLMTEARFYEKLPHKKIKCTLCPRECVIDHLERGYCGVRENREGVYYTLVHSRPCSANVDPIEKKPLFHFLPGSSAFSIATAGCNVECKFCQNWQISQVRPEQIQNYEMPPAAVVQFARQYNCASIAYTYSEPVIFAEYMYDCAVAGRKRGVKSVMISNAYINPEPLNELCSVLDAVKVDLKAFTEKFYKELVMGRLQPVLDALVQLKSRKMWTEIVYLVIPGKNDDEGELKEMCQWIRHDLGPETPLHFSRFHPQYRLLNIPPTPVETLRKARDIGLKAGLHYVYVGNVPGEEGENTRCPECGKLVIRRVGYTIRENLLKDGKCGSCGATIAGVWE